MLPSLIFVLQACLPPDHQVRLFSDKTDDTLQMDINWILLQNNSLQLLPGRLNYNLHLYLVYSFIFRYYGIASMITAKFERLKRIAKEYFGQDYLAVQLRPF